MLHGAARLLGEGDCHAVERTAHTLKGASANVGATGLAEVCAQVEMRAREGQLGDTADLVEHSTRNSNVCGPRCRCDGQGVTCRS